MVLATALSPNRGQKGGAAKTAQSAKSDRSNLFNAVLSFRGSRTLWRLQHSGACGQLLRLNITVGKVTKVWPRATAQKLYCEEIYLGEEKPWQDMEGKLAVVLAKLKPSKVELMQPPAGAKEVGDRVVAEGVEMLEPDDKLNEKPLAKPVLDDS
eukprot:s2974_g12.t1